MQIENPRTTLNRTDAVTWHPQRISTMIRKNPITSYASLPETKRGDFIHGEQKKSTGISVTLIDGVTNEGVSIMLTQEGVTRDQHHHSTSTDNK